MLPDITELHKRRSRATGDCNREHATFKRLYHHHRWHSGDRYLCEHDGRDRIANTPKPYVVDEVYKLPRHILPQFARRVALIDRHLRTKLERILVHPHCERAISVLVKKWPGTRVVYSRRKCIEVCIRWAGAIDITRHIHPCRCSRLEGGIAYLHPSGLQLGCEKPARNGAIRIEFHPTLVPVFDDARPIVVLLRLFVACNIQWPPEIRRAALTVIPLRLKGRCAVAIRAPRMLQCH